MTITVDKKTVDEVGFWLAVEKAFNTVGNTDGVDVEVDGKAVKAEPCYDAGHRAYRLTAGGTEVLVIRKPSGLPEGY